MPLMMDEEMMDDLFGDGGELSIPPRPPSKELYERLDDLRRAGCCQGVAWSNWGCIASIASSGAILELRNLRCHPETGEWGLSDASLTAPLTQNSDGGPLKHICWSSSGSELAVIDTAGRVNILSLFASLNKPTLHRHCQIDPIDELCGVVGCYWLTPAPYQPNRTALLSGPAVKEGANYKYETATAQVQGPFHPTIGKSALICVTTNGVLRLIFPQVNGKYAEAHQELESVLSSDDLITHAAICPDKNGTLLIAFATTSKQLRVVRALIDWGQQKPAERGPPIMQQPLNPTIKTRHAAATSWLHDAPAEGVSALSMEASMTQLSHLEILPSCADSTGKMTTATIVAVRSQLPPSMSHYNQEVHTVVDRWEVRDKMQPVHPAFEQLSSRRNSVGQPPGSIVFLKKLEGFGMNKILLTVQPMNLGKVLFFAYSDGSIEYRDRITMAETFTDHDLDRVWHLSQIGFSYSEDEPCLQVALSPSYCSLVHIVNDGKVKWKQLEYTLGDIGTSKSDPQYSAVVAALALSCSTAVRRSVAYDDLLPVAHRYSKTNLTFDWLVELSLILNATLDYSEEQHYDVLIRNTALQLCLSIQNSLGFRGEFKSRSFPGKLSWLVLQLRNIVVLVTMAANLNVRGGPNPNDKTSPLDDAEVIDALAGSVKWIFELMAWLIDTLLTLSTSLPSNIDLTSSDGFSITELHGHLTSTNTVSLHLLLSSSTRGFLTAICRRLTHLDYIAHRAIMQNSTSSGTSAPNAQNNSNHSHITPQLRNAYLHIATLTTGTVVRIKTIETLLANLTTSIKEVYRNNPLTSQPSDKSRNAFETKMLFGGQFPEVFKPVIVELFKNEGLLDVVRKDIEPAKLFFADFSILEVDEDKNSIAKRKAAGRTMDSFRKSWLKNPVRKIGVENGEETNGTRSGTGKQDSRWRRCARCAAVMEDVLTERRALQWLIMQQRRCFCSGYWDTLMSGTTVA
ncbi:mediator of RNA polymeras-like protein II transcription subunit 16 [Amylocarpus encephaloides]|uniref:Mediator of RNA polymerase II transcription subunit 16 n=1 Tax=Amylocarpus encephaloides TaxID=45428 RepID=A0A9P7YTI7_9HELO|nr:mediator of RNA polymeras-like protein II transcription subunit 16 [Amylocarpus encephaloides]